MDNHLSVAEVKELIKKAEQSFRHEDCNNCECYLGYIAQLRLDSDQDARSFLKEYIASRKQIHSCLGCDPCPPGILFADYLRKRKTGLE